MSIIPQFKDMDFGQILEEDIVKYGKHFKPLDVSNILRTSIIATKLFRKAFAIRFSITSQFET